MASSVGAIIPDIVVIRWACHLGAPSAPACRKGQRVKLGEITDTRLGGLGCRCMQALPAVKFVETRHNCVLRGNVRWPSND
jgi:hypothetical protein